MIGIAGIILSLALLIYLAYRGINVLLLAPIMALLAVVMQPGAAPVLANYTQVFMVELGKYVARYFPLFMLGALFGKLMDDSGAARSIAERIAAWTGARRAMLAIVLACGILTYGGVSLFVVAFAVYPIAAAMFRTSDIPKRFIPGAIALGSFTFTMTALPGTPAIQNAIPMPFFGTTPFAAPGLGIIGGILMLLFGMLWLDWRAGRARARGEGYGVHADEAVAARPGGAALELPPFWLALTPIVLVIGLNYVLSTWVLPALDTSYLALPRFGSTNLATVLGIWSIVGALAVSCVAVILTNRRRIANLADTLNKGTLGSMLPMFNTASEVGYGSVIASLAAFAVIRDAVTTVSGDPIISLAVAVNLLAGITGSASGGMSIVLAALGDTYLTWAREAGISPEIMHRVASMSSGGFDALPHNGAVITLLAICGLTHRESYFDIFMVACVFTVCSLIIVIVLNAVFGTF